MGSFNNINEGFAWFSGFANFEKKSPLVREYSLDRMAAMLADRGNPQNSFKSIHVAGSKGKGSTCAYAGRMLAELGYSTGIYASPHVTDWRERITTPSGFFPDGVYLEVIDGIFHYVESLPASWEWGTPTTFELLTLLAFELFRKAGIEWAVVETGLGGRLDATNLIKPELCLITHLELEHTEVLGPTLGHIAFEKAGIFKSGVPAISVRQVEDARIVLIQQAALRETPLSWLSDGQEIRIAGDGKTWLVPPVDADTCFTVHPSMNSRNQAMNAGLAWLGLRNLAKRKVITPSDHALESACSKAIENVSLRARQEELLPPSGSTLPRILLDAGHTRDSVLELVHKVETLKNGSESAMILFALAKDKDAPEILPALAGLGIPVIITRPGYFKESDPQGLFNLLNGLLPPGSPGATLQPDVKKGLALCLDRLGKNTGGLLVIAGSFYLCGEVLPELVSLGYQTGEAQ